MKKNRFPKGFDEAKIRGIADHYDGQSEDDAVIEDDAAWEKTAVAFVEVPRDLVDEVQALIRKRTGTDG